MTDLSEVADYDLTQRVQDAVQPGQLGTALRNAAGQLGIAIDWHNADVLAEALSHHYEREMATFVVVKGSGEQQTAREQMERELLFDVHQAGMALVEEPEVSFHPVESVLPNDRENRPGLASLTADQRDEIALYRGDSSLWVYVMTGRCRRLAKPRATTRGTHVH